MNVDRLAVGVATQFGVRAQGGTYWTSDMFAGWLRTGTGLPVQVDHAPLIDHRGVVLSVGAARRFCSVRTPVDGLLALLLRFYERDQSVLGVTDLSSSAGAEAVEHLEVERANELRV